jgi:hypothetical protein
VVDVELEVGHLAAESAEAHHSRSQNLLGCVLRGAEKSPDDKHRMLARNDGQTRPLSQSQRRQRQ